MRPVIYSKWCILQYKALFFLCLFIVVGFTSYGQSSVNNIGGNPTQLVTWNGSLQAHIGPLTIGDKVPDIKFDSVLNYPSKKARLSDFKSKLTILDFWSSSCSSCIGLFPHLQALKDQFKNDLQIVLVNGQTKIWHDNTAKVKSLLNRLDKQTGTAVHLPVVLYAKQLDHYFPYSRLPHEVWLDEQGKVIAITGAEEVNVANITAVLKGNMPVMHTKQDVSINLQKQTLFTLMGNSSLSFQKPVSASLLIKGWIDGLGCSTGVRHGDSPYMKLYTGLYLTNAPLVSIYAFAYRDQMKYPGNRVIVTGKNAPLFRKVNDMDATMYNRVYSYDLTVPPMSFDQMIHCMQNCLEGSFRTQVRVEDSAINCFIVKASPAISASWSKGGAQTYVMDEFDPKKYVRNIPVSDLLSTLNLRYFSQPLIDETGLHKDIDMDFSGDLSEAGIIHSLDQAGFQVTEQKRKMKVVVISDK